jgi:hypothetical protein
MRHRILRLSLLLCLTVLLRAQTNEWRAYKNIDGNFHVLFPVEPKDTVNPAQEPIHSHTFLAMYNAAGYTVIYATQPKEEPVDEASFEEYKKDFLKELPKCEVAKDQPAAPAIQGFVGHWYRLTCADVKMVGNLYWGKHYAYAVLVIFPNNIEEPPDTKRFIDSFSLIAPA